MIEKLLRAPAKVRNTLRARDTDRCAVLHWATEGVIRANWGDKLNGWMAERISGKRILHREDVYAVGATPVHYWIGSHLATACGDPRAEVWGAGFISRTVPITGRPRAIHAVRGWLSDARLREAGLPAPGVVGDAALLLPRLYTPRRDLPRRSLGVIPHVFEREEAFFVQAGTWDDVRVIDITGGIEEVIDQIVACDRVISSSLHGIICADAYGVPSLWLHGSDKPAGDGFKFLDYFSSVGRPDTGPIPVHAETTRSEVEARFFEYTAKIDLDALWAACPLRPR
jgi:hypothetical protein